MSERDNITRRWQSEVARLKGGYEREIAALQEQLAEARAHGPATAAMVEWCRTAVDWFDNYPGVSDLARPEDRANMARFRAFVAEHEPPAAADEVVPVPCMPVAPEVMAEYRRAAAQFDRREDIPR